MVNIKKTILQYQNIINFLLRSFLLTFVFLNILDFFKIITLEIIVDPIVVFSIYIFLISGLFFLFFEKQKQKKEKYKKAFKILFYSSLLLLILSFFEIAFLKEISLYIAVFATATGVFLIYFDFKKLKEEFFKNEDEDDLKALKVVSYLIPLFIVAGVFYINYLPFGYEEKITLDVGNPNDTQGNFFIEGDGLGPRQKIDDEYFRYIDGPAYLVYEPRTPLEDATAVLTWEGENLTYPIQPSLDFNWDYEWDIDNIGDDFIVETKKFDLEDFENAEVKKIEDEDGNLIQDYTIPFKISFEWTIEKEKVLLNGDISLKQDLQYITLQSDSVLINYELEDFSVGEEKTATVTFDGEYLDFYVNEEEQGYSKQKKGIEYLEINKGIFKNYDPDFFKKEIEEKDGCIYFKNTRLELPNSTNRFEEGPWVVYVEWMPEDLETNYQQIIGHFNWEISQQKDEIEFRIGRMEFTNDTVRITHQIDKTRDKNSLIAVYQPNPLFKKGLEKEQGYISLFINDSFIGKRNFFNDYIRNDYSRNLTLGHTYHGRDKERTFYSGNICNFKFAYRDSGEQSVNSLEQSFDENDKIRFILPTGKLDKLHLEIKK